MQPRPTTILCSLVSWLCFLQFTSAESVIPIRIDEATYSKLEKVKVLRKASEKDMADFLATTRKRLWSELRLKLRVEFDVSESRSAAFLFSVSPKKAFFLGDEESPFLDEKIDSVSIAEILVGITALVPNAEIDLGDDTIVIYIQPLGTAPYSDGRRPEKDKEKAEQSEESKEKGE